MWAADGKEMALIPAGNFLMGNTEEEARRLAEERGYDEKLTLAETPQRKISLPTFYMDVTPVTQAEYARFLAAYPNYDVPFIDERWAQPYNWDKTTATAAWRVGRAPGGPGELGGCEHLCSLVGQAVAD